MDAKKNDLNKLVKELTQSAREFASYGLQYGSRALDFTAAKLKTVEAGLKKRAEKWNPPKAEAKEQAPTEQAK
jgi:hypothetical protein